MVREIYRERARAKFTRAKALEFSENHPNALYKMNRKYTNSLNLKMKPSLSDTRCAFNNTEH